MDIKNDTHDCPQALQALKDFYTGTALERLDEVEDNIKSALLKKVTSLNNIIELTKKTPNVFFYLFDKHGIYADWHKSEKKDWCCKIRVGSTIKYSIDSVSSRKEIEQIAFNECCYVLESKLKTNNKTK